MRIVRLENQTTSAARCHHADVSFPAALGGDGAGSEIRCRVCRKPLTFAEMMIAAEERASV
jgi:hypothetical protein